MKRTLNPIWDEVVRLDLNQDECVDGVENSLAGAMLYLTVMDDDYATDNEVVGTVALNLKDLCSNVRTEIRRPILRNGQEFGVLECTVSLTCNDAAKVKS